MYSLIITAAGNGNRFKANYNKVLHNINDKTIIELTIEKFIEFSEFCEIIVVINKNDINFFENIKKKYPITIVIGGNSRAESVYNGLLEAKKDIVFIHDGARCFISKKLIKKCINTIKKEKYEAYTLAISVVDTIKFGENGNLTKNLDRNKLYQIQTPQIFNKKELLSYIKKSKLDYTDEATLFIENNKKVKIIDGDINNIKVTYRKDINNYE